SSLPGCYIGLVIFILGAVTGIAYYGWQMHEDRRKYLVLGGFEIFCFVCCLLAVFMATLCMRSLVKSSHRHAEPVEIYLLFEAFCGEIVWCTAELARYIEIGGDVIILVVVLVRLVHVFTQTWFILIAFELVASESSGARALRGRQCVAFLLMTNLALLIFHIIESMTDGFGYVNSSMSNYTYVKLLAGPMIAFYRFHCSVCLAEVWKATFS
ncbi:hypothetical protein PMAYCL1PPCAC_15050, partial [Pristionchus mayeri]